MDVTDSKTPKQSWQRAVAWDASLSVVIGAIVALVGWEPFGKLLETKDGGTFIASHAFLILALLPGLAAILHYFVAELPRYRRRAETYDKWSTLKLPPDLRVEGWRTKGAAEYLKRYETDTAETRPKFAGVLFGAVCLTTVFSVAAALSNGTAGIGWLSAVANEAQPDEPPFAAPSAAKPAPEAGAASSPGDQQEGAPAEQQAKPSANAAGTNAEKTETEKEETTPEPEPRSRDEEGQRGLVYAAYGAYVYVLRLFIGRLNSSGISGKFLLRLSIRGAVALVLGYAAGALQVFKTVADGGPTLFAYFAVGLFPAMAMSALEKKGRELFLADGPGCEVLPLCLIDGLDDDVADRLAEIGIWDVEHLAYSNPLEIALRTTFPQYRILDWMDQALLVIYARKNVVHFRKLGIRGAIEMAVLYGDLTGQMESAEPEQERKTRADELLKVLAQKSDIDPNALKGMGRSLFEDQHVSLIWDLWQAVPEKPDGAKGEESNEEERT